MMANLLFIICIKVIKCAKDSVVATAFITTSAIAASEYLQAPSVAVAGSARLRR